MRDLILGILVTILLYLGIRAKVIMNFMDLMCKVHGHQPPVYAEKGWFSPGEGYAKVTVGLTDGIGRTHATVYGECARCGKEFIICRIHLPMVAVV